MLSLRNAVSLSKIAAGEYFFLHRTNQQSPAICLMGVMHGENEGDYSGPLILELPLSKSQDRVGARRLSSYQPGLGAVVDDVTVIVDPASISGSSITTFGSPTPGHVVIAGDDIYMALSGGNGDTPHVINLRTGLTNVRQELTDWISFSDWRLEVPARDTELLHEPAA